MPINELKPCPFCGGEAEFNKWPHKNPYYYIKCKNNCHENAYPTKEEAIQAWNTRKGGPE